MLYLPVKGPFCGFHSVKSSFFLSIVLYCGPSFFHAVEISLAGIHAGERAVREQYRGRGQCQFVPMNPLHYVVKLLKGTATGSFVKPARRCF